ncbi:MAG: hypothetical protein KJ709_09390 [Nanoarchaeota archaeon]|nr:hypothetical protein [Nanoarchaeota archaeon]
MINLKDQEELFRLIADYLEEDITCICIGGTAMMFMGYKTTTKDIDLVFGSSQDRQVFIKALEKLGYTQRSMKTIYDRKRTEAKDKPLLFSRGEERFDLFVKNIFGFIVDCDLDKIEQKHDFVGKKELITYVLPKELIILLKILTDREKDFEDIMTIIDKEKNVDWDMIIDEAIRQRKNNSWMLLDLKEKLQKLRKTILIKEKHFKRIYSAEEKYH